MKQFYVFSLLLIAAGCAHVAAPGDSFVAIQIQDRNGATETISSPEKLEHYEKIDFLSSQPFKKVVRVYKQKGENQSILTTYHPNGSIAQYLEAKEMRAYGAYREWFPNGQPKIDAYLVGGPADISPGAQKEWLFDKTCSVWDEEGHVMAQIPYEKGSLQGTSLLYYASGALKSKRAYHKNVEDGDQIEYFQNGSIKSSIQFEKGTKHGKTLGFFENNKPAWEEKYAQGLLLNGIYYNSQQAVIARVEDGRGVQAQYADNYLAFLMDIRQGVPEGVIKKFTSKEELEALYSIKGGKKHGEEIHYYPVQAKNLPHLPKLSIQWDRGTIHGIVKTWYISGQLQSQREYCRNQKLGPSCAWYKNGALMFIEEYEEGQLMKGAYYKKNQNDPISTIANGNGIAHVYDEDGIFLKKIVYAKGKPVDPEERR